MIKLHIHLHGALRDKLPSGAKGRTTLSLPDGATIMDVLERLSLRRNIEVAVNDEIADNLDDPLQDGDRLEMFRPAAGGCGLAK